MGRQRLCMRKVRLAYCAEWALDFRRAAELFMEAAAEAEDKGVKASCLANAARTASLCGDEDLVARASEALEALSDAPLYTWLVKSTSKYRRVAGHLAGLRAAVHSAGAFKFTLLPLGGACQIRGYTEAEFRIEEVREAELRELTSIRRGEGWLLAEFSGGFIYLMEDGAVVGVALGEKPVPQVSKALEELSKLIGRE
ncbi:MAG: hypothetical protein DRN96_03440 [Thermoproteota archaeon]|nr:MAG: hypothetical protein DRN96_03440 [Candidatus Korarchaeota archaeon]